MEKVPVVSVILSPQTMDVRDSYLVMKSKGPHHAGETGNKERVPMLPGADELLVMCPKSEMCLLSNHTRIQAGAQNWAA